MKYYHATPYENLDSIIDNGLKRGMDNVIYLADNPKSAALFVALRGCRDILVVEVKLPKSKVSESFDHCENFFKCKAFTYNKDIKFEKLTNFTRYDLNKGNQNGISKENHQ